MSALCCPSTKPYRPTRTEHEAKFASFLAWAGEADISSALAEPKIISDKELAELKVEDAAFVIQWVSQINFGPLLSKRYFLSRPTGASSSFVEVPEQFLVMHNFAKLNTYKNFKCTAHNRFLELNLYQRDPMNRHHWRADMARPGGEIDLTA